MSIAKLAGPNDLLPARLTSLVGREHDVAAVCALLRQDVRLLTLTGPGGIGKTRLAAEVAAQLRPEFAAGVCYVPLAPITDPDLVVPTIAHALGLRDRGARTAWDELSAYLRNRHLLLVLDNFEQVARAAPKLADLLACCPSLCALVTSRAVLRLSIERDFPVTALAMPDPTEVRTVEQIAATAAVNLFVARASAVRPDFILSEANAQDVAEICRRLDGLPLAIELAAARVRHLSPAALLERLERRLPLLSGGPRDQPERLRTMRDAIAWSYDLLDASEQRLFRCLSAFVGGFSVDAAEAVLSVAPTAGAVAVNRTIADGQWALEDLASLVDQSLVQVEADSGTRFGMLQTIREFGVEQLAASAEAETVHRAHASWCIELAERTEPELHGPAQHQWWRLLETEHDNLRAGLTWLDQVGEVETCLRLAAALSSFWWFGGHLREGSRWLERALARAGAAPARVHAQALEGAGFLTQSQGDDTQGVALFEQSLALYREIADNKGIASTLYSLGVAAEDRGDYDRAMSLLTETAARAEELGDHRTRTFALLHLGIVAYGQGDLQAAVAYSETGISLARAIESTLGGLLGTFCLALVATDRGEHARAASHYREVVDWLDAAGVFGETWPRRSADSVGRTLAAIATLAVGHGQTERAARLFGAAAADYEAIGQAPALPERDLFERATDRAKRKLGASAFQAVFATGQTMTPVEARADIEAALALPDEASFAQDEGPLAATLGLTSREHDILRLLAQGRTDKEIGAALFISSHTVTGHVAHILAKLDVPNRTSAANYAVRHGLV
ncbi:MAG: LuxR C-terminal-related transcriptional regulator [Thermomicrobiales bacterium]